MLQSSKISKFTNLRLGFLTLSAIVLLSGFMTSVGAEEHAAPAAAAAPAPVVPGKPKADIAAGEALFTNGDPARGVVACIGCHGANGKSAVGTWPKLAAQHTAYIAKELKNYKDGTRANPVMTGMAATVNDQDIANVAAYLSKQEPSLGVAQDKATIELGQNIYRAGMASKGIPACAACHGPSGAGIPAQYPRMAGQWAEYTAAQLTYFRDGTRKNSVQMSAIAAKLSDVEIKAVADYMAGLH